MSEAVVERILARLGAGPAAFSDLLLELHDVEYRDILRAWGTIRERIRLGRDEQGRYLLPGTDAVSTPQSTGLKGDTGM